MKTTGLQPDQLSNYFDKLPSPYSDLLIMYYQQQLSFEVIADHFGLPVNTVLHQFNKACYLLKRKIELPEIQKGLSILYSE